MKNREGTSSPGENKGKKLERSQSLPPERSQSLPLERSQSLPLDRSPFNKGEYEPLKRTKLEESITNWISKKNQELSASPTIKIDSLLEAKTESPSQETGTSKDDGSTMLKRVDSEVLLKDWGPKLDDQGSSPDRVQVGAETTDSKATGPGQPDAKESTSETTQVDKTDRLEQWKQDYLEETRKSVLQVLAPFDNRKENPVTTPQERYKRIKADLNRLSIVELITINARLQTINSYGEKLENPTNADLEAITYIRGGIEEMRKELISPIKKKLNEEKNVMLVEMKKEEKDIN